MEPKVFFYGKLSKREEELVAMVAEGMTNKEIAHSLWISEGTVKNYLHNVLTKLNLKDRREIIILVHKKTE